MNQQKMTVRLRCLCHRRPMVNQHLLRDWILLVCFSWRYEATEGPCVNFVMREALFEIYTWILVPFWLRNIRFLIQNTRSLFYGRHYSSLHRLMSLHRKLNVKSFLMFIVAENTGSVNITIKKTPAYVDTPFSIRIQLTICAISTLIKTIFHL